MEELLITEEELEYFTNIPINMVCEDPAPYKSQKGFEKAVKACNGITLDQFSRNIDETIMRLIPTP